LIYRSSFRIDIIKIIKKELKFVTEKHSERIEEYKAKHRLEKLEGKKVYDKPVIRTGDKAGCYGSGLILLGSVLGIIYDFYYLGVYNLGIATMLYPLTIVIMFKLWKHIPNGPVQRFLVFFILIFFLDFASIGMAYLYQLTAYPLNDFITYNLAPSLIFNILAFLFFQKLLERIYL